MAINSWKLLAVAGAATLIIMASTGAYAAEKSTENNVVKDGTVVSFEYTLSGEDGKAIESNKGKEPLKYVQGQHMMIPGLEKELAGMKVGQEKHVEIKPEDAYGHVDPGAVLELPKEKIPAEAQKAGAVLTTRGPQGESRQVKVKEVKEKTVVLDMNHPMAGKTLVFDVKVLDIQPFTPPQKAQPSSPPAPAAKPTQPAQPK